ncbi:MAG: Gfo/Idh/MocA family oxidoreductase [Alphaproteobacteria bacterium]|jgi:predicted dehydrogenase|nr:Gfo/Idh/MocA family oxidoreductase [Alphaproteobacteria bacterium]MDP6590438.1 Gfo/Idh/MocA family oxidoreductase [Alphaproteobacteria bacterium]MDP6818451.1 Gfo/Idh/MocA family oxidoreductase [Alphaproteobacteria bacterium]|tara:strand:+ start:307 stop:1308 length:1002 start_codon:yes stop_codon:yes gene_type:complete
MLRAAAIGLGWWADELTRAIDGKSEKIRVTACHSRSAENRARFCQRFGTAPYESYQAVLADGDIDAVLLCTPHSLHAEQVEQAARAGKHVFVEKPFTLTQESGRAAARACSDAGRVLAVGHNRRFAAATREVKRMLEAGEFGTALHCEANFSNPRPLSYAPDGWRANRTESPGGGIAGMGVHMIDAMTHFLGPVTRVTAQAKRLAVAVDIDDTTSALFEFDSGATGYLGTFSACPQTVFFNLYGTHANAFAEPDANRLRVHRSEEEPAEVALTPVDTLLAELEEFADACAGGAAFRVRPEEAIHTVAVMQAMVAAAERGDAVAIGGAPSVAIK